MFHINSHVSRRQSSRHPLSPVYVEAGCGGASFRGRVIPFSRSRVPGSTLGVNLIWRVAFPVLLALLSV